MRATTTCQYLDVYLRKYQAPYNNLTATQRIKIDTARTEVELLFANPTAEPSALVGMDLLTAGGSIYIDNVDLREANVSYVNPDDSIKFEYNATLNGVLFKVNDIDDLERKMKSLIFGKNLSVDPSSYLNIYGEGTLINSYWGLYED